MKATCKYTGLPLLSSSGFARWCAVTEHPIFTAPLPDLIELAAAEWSPEMFILDKKLLLLAIAKNCELISWNEKEAIIPANPPIGVIEASIEPLLTVAGWIDFQRYNNRDVNYPTLRVTEETATLHSLPNLLRSVINARDDDARMERREHRLKCLESNARNLSAKCRIGANRESALLRTTADWALLVTEEQLNTERVDTSIREDWREMLMTSAGKLKASRFSMADVEELHDFMTGNLPHGSVIAHDVIAHCHRLLLCNEINDIDGDNAILSARILTSGTLVACETEPKRDQFPTLIEYARARAHWILQQRQREETARQLEVLKKQQVSVSNSAGGNDENSI